MDVYCGRFASNGACGYVLKPNYLRYDKLNVAACAPSPMLPETLSTSSYASNTPQILHIKVRARKVTIGLSSVCSFVRR